MQIYVFHEGGFQLICHISVEERYQMYMSVYSQNTNIWLTKSKNLSVSCLVLQSSLRNQLKPGVKSTGDAPTSSE